MGLSDEERCNVLIITASYGAGHLQVSNALELMIKQLRPDWNVEIHDFLNYAKPIIKKHFCSATTRFSSILAKDINGTTRHKPVKPRFKMAADDEPRWKRKAVGNHLQPPP
jgi:flavodoxin